jgi:hypothetical protein
MLVSAFDEITGIDAGRHLQPESRACAQLRRPPRPVRLRCRPMGLLRGRPASSRRAAGARQVRPAEVAARTVVPRPFFFADAACAGARSTGVPRGDLVVATSSEAGADADARLSASSEQPSSGPRRGAAAEPQRPHTAPGAAAPPARQATASSPGDRQVASEPAGAHWGLQAEDFREPLSSEAGGQEEQADATRRSRARRQPERGCCGTRAGRVGGRRGRRWC